MKSSNEDKHNEFCAEITPEQENIDFLKSYIRCTDNDFGTVSLFILFRVGPKK